MPQNFQVKKFEDIDKVGESLSRPRFRTYLELAGWDERLAAELYIFNGELAGAMMWSLGIAEVSLRNAVDRRLSVEYGDRWHLSDIFIHEILTDQGRNTLLRSIGRMDRKFNSWSKDDLVSDLSFDFWSNMMRPDYGLFWSKHLRHAFPNRGEADRHTIQQVVKNLNVVRNRVAHFEPVLSSNPSAAKASAIKLTRLICPSTSLWARKNCWLASIEKKRPRKGASSECLAARADSKVLILTGDEGLLDVIGDLKRSSPVCIRELRHGGGACLPIDILNFAYKTSEHCDGMVDFSDIKMGDVFNAIPPGRIKYLPKEAPMTKVSDVLQSKSGPDIVVSFDVENQSSTGAIVRAHRRY